MKKVITLLVALAASWASYAQTDLDTTFWALPVQL
jgi:hypothetical protein